MEPEEERISVWVCQEEKLVSGLSRRTTCADVVRVLLEDSRRQRRQQQQQQQQQQRGGGMLSGPPQSYCIVEKWRGFERSLPNKTRILRLWAAWGGEQENVRFVLVRSEASLPNAGPRSAEARVVPSRESPGPPPGQQGPPAVPGAQERHRRVVRKAFRKLAKLNRRRGPQPPHERMETLVHLVLSQDHTLRQQLKRLRELDREIDRYEARVHQDRVRRHGANYVQDTYLDAGEPEPPEPEPPPPEEPPQQQQQQQQQQQEARGQLEELARRCEQVARLQEQRCRQEELLERLAAEIQEELNERWMRRRREELEALRGSRASLSEADCDTTELTGGAGGGGGGEERERLNTQLSTSLYIGLRLSNDLHSVRGDLERTRRAWADKERELQHLQDTLRALGVREGEGREGEAQQEALQAQDGAPVPAELWGPPAAPGLGKDCEDNDEDSDTGLSSMHSQDSDSVPVCESLV